MPTGEEVTQTRLPKYQQLTFEIRERGPGFAMEVVPVVFGCLGGGGGGVVVC